MISAVTACSVPPPPGDGGGSSSGGGPSGTTGSNTRATDISTPGDASPSRLGREWVPTGSGAGATRAAPTAVVGPRVPGPSGGRPAPRGPLRPRRPGGAAGTILGALNLFRVDAGEL